MTIPPVIKPHLDNMLSCSAVGTVDQVAQSLSTFQELYQPDEFIISMPFHDHSSKLKSMELAMEARTKLKPLDKVA